MIFLLVLTLPVISFPFGDLLGPEWQTGSTGDRLALHLDPEVTILFAPFIVLAWVATLAAIVAEKTMARWRTTRLALYSGVILTAHYLVLSLIVLTVVPVVVFVFVVAVLLGIRKLRQLLGNRVLGWGFAAVLAVAALIGLVRVFDPEVRDNPFVIVGSLTWIVLVMAGPVLCFAASLHRSGRVWAIAGAAAGTHRFVVLEGVGVAAWLGGYLIAWQRAATKAAELYTELPASSPDCYVATAAAAGHPRLVGSQPVEISATTAVAINGQLRTLKLAEIAVAANWPGVHTSVRRIYDSLGPRLAARLSTATRADAAYVLLKPCELLGALINRASFPDRKRLEALVYPSGASSDSTLSPGSR